MKPADKHRAHGNRAATRTAWIVGGIALAIYAGALVLGHMGGLNASWEPRPAAQQTSASVAAPGAPAQVQQVAAVPVAAVARASDPSSRP